MEAFYLDVVDGKELPALPVERVRMAFYAYLGEAVKHHLGGEWKLGTLKSDEAYKTPIILGWGKEGSDHARISPVVWEIFLVRDRERVDLAAIIERAAAQEK